MERNLVLILYTVLDIKKLDISLRKTHKGFTKECLANFIIIYRTFNT